MEWSNTAKVYRPRKPRATALWQIIDGHFDEFEASYDELYSRRYGFFRTTVSHQALGIDKFFK